MTAPVQQYVAHYRKTGEIQSLETHLLESSLLASTFARKLGLHEAGELIGLLHDLGKYSDEFQRYLRSAVGISEQDPDEEGIASQRLGGKVDHSSAGAQQIWQCFRDRNATERIVGEILAICVASHHSGLIDCLDNVGCVISD